MNSLQDVREDIEQRMQRLRDATAATRGHAPETCPSCKGTGWTVRTTDPVRRIRRAARCECWYPKWVFR